MKKITYIAIMVGVSFMLPSCADNDDGVGFENFQPAIDEILGSDEVELETTVEYSVPPRSGSTYVWSSTTGTVATGTNSDGNEAGNIIRLTFGELATSATITVTETAVSGNTTSQDLAVSITNSSPLATASTVGPGSYKDGLSDSVKVLFDFPVSAPTISSSGLTANLSGVTMTSLDESTTEYFTIVAFDAGGADSDVEFTISGATRLLGGMVLSDTTLAAKVDNTAPVATVAFDKTIVKDGDEVTFSLSFEEDIVTTDSLLTLTITGTGVSIDTTFTLGESGSWSSPVVELPLGLGDQTFEYDIRGNLTDLAKNDLDTIAVGDLLSDNTIPVLSGSSAVDSGSSATLSVTSNETGTVYFTVLESGADAPTAAAFMDDAVASASDDAVGGFANAFLVALATGSYDVYFLSRDEAGNLSAISGPVALTMN